MNKIVGEIFMARLIEVMDKMVFPNQSAFFNEVVMVNEVDMVKKTQNLVLFLGWILRKCMIPLVEAFLIICLPNFFL